MSSFQIKCPKCQQSSVVKLAGIAPGSTKRTRCPSCQNEFAFRVPQTLPPASPASTTPPPAGNRPATQRPVTGGGPRIPQPSAGTAAPPDDPFGGLQLPAAPTSPRPFTSAPPPKRANQPKRSRSTQGNRQNQVLVFAIGGTVALVLLVGVGIWLAMGGLAALPTPLRTAVRSVAPVMDSNEAIIADLKAAEKEIKNISLSIVEELAPADDASDDVSTGSADDPDAELTVEEERAFKDKIAEIARVRVQLIELLARATTVSEIPIDEALSMDELRKASQDIVSLNEDEKEELVAAARKLGRKRALPFGMALSNTAPFFGMVMVYARVINVECPEDPNPAEALAYEQLKLERQAIAVEAEALATLSQLLIDADDERADLKAVSKMPEWKQAGETLTPKLTTIASQMKDLGDRVGSAFREETYSGTLQSGTPLATALDAAIQCRLTLERQLKSMAETETAKESISEMQRKSSLVKSMYRQFRAAEDKPKESIAQAPVQTQAPKQVPPEPQTASRDTSASPSPGSNTSGNTTSSAPTDSSSAMQPKDGVADTSPGPNFPPGITRPGFGGPRMRGPMGSDPSMMGPPMTGPGMRGPGMRGPTMRGPGMRGPGMGSDSRPGTLQPGSAPRPPGWATPLGELKDVRDMDRPEWAETSILMRTREGDNKIGRVVPNDANLDPSFGSVSRHLSQAFQCQVASQGASNVWVFHLSKKVDLDEITNQLRSIRVVQRYPEEGLLELSVE